MTHTDSDSDSESEVYFFLLLNILEKNSDFLFGFGELWEVWNLYMAIALHDYINTEL